jgi:hypothetical protein
VPKKRILRDDISKLVPQRKRSSGRGIARERLGTRKHCRNGEARPVCRHDHVANQTRREHRWYDQRNPNKRAPPTRPQRSGRLPSSRLSGGRMAPYCPRKHPTHDPSFWEELYTAKPAGQSVMPLSVCPTAETCAPARRRTLSKGTQGRPPSGESRRRFPDSSRPTGPTGPSGARWSGAGASCTIPNSALLGGWCEAMTWPRRGAPGGDMIRGATHSFRHGDRSIDTAPCRG